MKRRDLLDLIAEYAAENGLPYTELEGANHTKIRVGSKQATIRRHREVNELTARAILKQIGVTP
ncbi:toxin HicA [Microlunatus elymi]|uniref:Toxin HicA n=1 Tax=Microlunatus elymi TaxID=2596828 RepID=A0A516Q3M3_9ACTN|nr:toxin HicA [Microlunatus elymi]QDP98026.1 toxin HicA [Microlunatus elymi]